MSCMFVLIVHGFFLYSFFTFLISCVFRVFSVCCCISTLLTETSFPAPITPSTCPPSASVLLFVGWLRCCKERECWEWAGWWSVLDSDLLVPTDSCTHTHYTNRHTHPHPTQQALQHLQNPTKSPYKPYINTYISKNKHKTTSKPLQGNLLKNCNPVCCFVLEWPSSPKHHSMHSNTRLQLHDCLFDFYNLKSFTIYTPR